MDEWPVDNARQIEQVARVCHEALRAFCETLGDDSLPPWDKAPEWQKESSRAGVRSYFEQFAAGVEPTAEEIHERWLKEKRAAGWKRGDTKDHETREHPSFVPYGDLPLDEKRKDYLFAAVCQAFCESAAAEASTTKAKK